MLDNIAVLIVEDERLIADLLAEVVIERGGTVLGPAGSVSKALIILRTATPDAAILDAMLPDDDVSPISLILSAGRVPFIVYTGTGAQAEITLDTHKPPVLQKPLPAGTVVDCLEAELLRRHAA